MTSQSTHVIFGTGPLGQSVMRALLAQGETVRMVNRSGHAELPQQVELVAGDSSNPSQARDLAADAKVVYQCAMPPYDQWPDLFPALHGAILDAAAAANAVFVFGDNLYMYGDTNGAPLHEGLPYNAQTRKGRVRAELAEATLQAHADGRVRAVLARGADFFGPGVT
ncbi:MAG: NAD-dependent epimerase/dehydratase family protein, partial [Anaerolineales bacterium]